IRMSLFGIVEKASSAGISAMRVQAKPQQLVTSGAPPGGPGPGQGVGGPNAREAIAAEYARLMAGRAGKARETALSPVLRRGRRHPSGMFSAARTLDFRSETLMSRG